jgi:hypothetical protein
MMLAFQVLKCADHKSGGCIRAVKIIRNKKRFHHQALVEVKILNFLRQKVGYQWVPGVLLKAPPDVSLLLPKRSSRVYDPRRILFPRFSFDQTPLPIATRKSWRTTSSCARTTASICGLSFHHELPSHQSNSLILPNVTSPKSPET